MASAKSKLLEYFKKNVATLIDRDTLYKVANVHDWQRSIRTLRDEGWQIVSLKDGYILESLDQLETNKKRIAINKKIRYAVLHTYNSTCQRCGRSPDDGIKLEIDHKLPVSWGGKTEIDNLWPLCSECNGGKKNLFSDFKDSVMTEVMKQDSGYKKMLVFFKLTPNETVSPYILDIISGIRDWERTLRLIRRKEQMDIVWVKPNKDFPKGGYIYTPNDT